MLPVEEGKAIACEELLMNNEGNLILLRVESEHDEGDELCEPTPTAKNESLAV